MNWFRLDSALQKEAGLQSDKVGTGWLLGWHSVPVYLKYICACFGWHGDAAIWGYLLFVFLTWLVSELVIKAESECSQALFSNIEIHCTKRVQSPLWFCVIYCSLCPQFPEMPNISHTQNHSLLWTYRNANALCSKQVLCCGRWRESLRNGILGHCCITVSSFLLIWDFYGVKCWNFKVMML